MQTPGSILKDKEPEDAFKKATGDKVGFEYYFLNKLLLNCFNVSKLKGFHPKF